MVERSGTQGRLGPGQAHPEHAGLEVLPDRPGPVGPVAPRARRDPRAGAGAGHGRDRRGGPGGDGCCCPVHRRAVQPRRPAGEGEGAAAQAATPLRPFPARQLPSGRAAGADRPDGSPRGRPAQGLGGEDLDRPGPPVRHDLRRGSAGLSHDPFGPRHRRGAAAATSARRPGSTGASSPPAGPCSLPGWSRKLPAGSSRSTRRSRPRPATPAGRWMRDRARAKPSSRAPAAGIRRTRT